MGIIPWLMMLRLRRRQAERREGEKNNLQDTPAEQEKRRMQYMEWKAQSRARNNAASMQSLPDPLNLSRGLFD